jgi:hypothetical protein
MTAAGSLTSLPVVIVVAIVVMVALVLLLIWALTRDRNVARTSFGFYIDRSRYDDDGPEEADTQVVWPSERQP